MNNFKDIQVLRIYKGGTFAGILQRTEQGCEFSQDRAFIESSQYDYFSYCIPKSTQKIVIQGDNLPPFFAGLLPEGRRLNALISKIKTAGDDLFSLFAAVGTDCIGDIYVGDLVNTIPAKPQAELASVNFYSLFEETVSPDTELFDSKALAGVQEKISASMMSFPLSMAKNDKAYILKLNPADKPNLIQNELYCLQLAKKCGFSVAHAKLIVDKDKNPGLLVERFDRVQTQKIHQEDACQFLNRYPADKYRITINQIAEAIMHLCNAPQLQILNLMRQIAFSYLICNGDLHAKNISLQTLENGSIGLTPLYDLICTALYSDYNMALKMDGRDDNFKRKAFVNFAVRYKISAKAVEAMLDGLLARFAKHRHLLSQIEMTDKKRKFVEQLVHKRICDLQ